MRGNDEPSLAIETVTRAVVCPPAWLPDGRAHLGAVFAADGREVLLARAAQWSAARDPVAPPASAAGLEMHRGRWLFGGWLRTHFGNFLEDSLSRLWPLAMPDRPRFDGIVYWLGTPAEGRAHSRRDVTGSLAVPYIADAFALLDPGCPIVVLTGPAAFEELVVGDHCAAALTARRPGAGAARHRLFARLAEAAPPISDAAQRIYVARSGLPVEMSRFLLEDVFERGVTRAGYAIVRPETLPLAEQLARYAAARRLIFAEGSPVHLAASAVDRRARVAVINRRWPVKPKFGRQLLAGRARSAHTIVAWEGAVGRLSDDGAALHPHGNSSHVLPDFPALGEALGAIGLIDSGKWPSPSREKYRRAINEALAAKRALGDGLTYGWVADPRHVVVTHRGGPEPVRRARG